MQFRQLQYFLAVAEELNFRKAAERLYVTQPLLSKQIAELEQEIGMPLFVRNTRKVSLTNAGEILMREANQLLQQTLSLGNRVRHEAADRCNSGSLRIVFEEAFDRALLVKTINRFCKKYPAVAVDLHMVSFNGCLQRLDAEMADCAFITLPDRKLTVKTNFRILCGDVLSLVADKEALTDDSLEAFQALAMEKSVLLLGKSAKGVNQIVTMFNGMNLSPNYVFLEDLRTMLLYAEIGMGVSVVPRSMVETYHSPYLMAYDLHGYDTELCMECVWHDQNQNPLRELLLDEFPVQQEPCSNCTNTWCHFHG